MTTFESLNLPVANDVLAARQYVRSLNATDQLGFVLDLTGRELANGDPATAMRLMDKMFGRTLGSLGLYRSAYTDFGLRLPGVGEFELHVDGDPDHEVAVDALNLLLTYSGEFTVDLVPTTAQFWSLDYDHIPPHIGNNFKRGRMNTDLFGQVYSAHVKAPALVVHQVNGRYPVAHRYAGVGTVVRHSASLLYCRRNRPVSVQTILRDKMPES